MPVILRRCWWISLEQTEGNELPITVQECHLVCQTCNPRLLSIRRLRDEWTIRCTGWIYNALLPIKYTWWIYNALLSIRCTGWTMTSYFSSGAQGGFIIPYFLSGVHGGSTTSYLTSDAQGGSTPSYLAPLYSKINHSEFQA